MERSSIKNSVLYENIAANCPTLKDVSNLAEAFYKIKPEIQPTQKIELASQEVWQFSLRIIMLLK